MLKGGEGSEALVGELQEHCKSRLQRFQYPHDIVFVDDLPKTVTGKIQKFRMREVAVEELGLQRAAGVEFEDSPATTGRNCGAGSRAVKVGPSACAARTADAAPLTAHRSRAVLCPGRGRGGTWQAVFAVAGSPKH